MSSGSSPTGEAAKAPLDLAPTEKNVTTTTHVPDIQAYEETQKTKGLSGKSLIFACGAALYSDGYINAISGTVTTLITGYDQPYASASDSEITRFTTLFPSMSFAGTVLGMLTFGLVVDRTGRKWGMLICSAILVLFSILAAGAYGANNSTSGLFTCLIVYRFLIGIGIGGEYPAGSVACAENTEQANIKKNQQQGLFILATNSCIDIAFVIAPFTVWILYKIFGVNHIAWVWRLALGFGAIPPLILFFLRTKIQEPPSYKRGAIKHHMPWWLIIKKYWLRLAAVSIVW
jgi:MFS family permease